MAETQPTTSPSSFRPTDSQWQSLKIEPVQLKTFQNQHRIDGKIANDDDATTPVLSPYSGRVTKLFVKAGDEVKPGQPLLSLAATELVQAQNDLINAVSTLHTTQAQLNLAQTTEKRQRDLYDSKGAAGQIAYLSLLTAQQVYYQTLISLVQAKAIRLADTAALFQALGGDWWNRSDVVVKQGRGGPPPQKPFLE